MIASGRFSLRGCAEFRGSSDRLVLSYQHRLPPRRGPSFTVFDRRMSISAFKLDESSEHGLQPFGFSGSSQIFLRVTVPSLPSGFDL
jgi:hypothetical protein